MFDNRRITKCSSAEEGLPIDIKSATYQVYVLGGKVSVAYLGGGGGGGGGGLRGLRHPPPTQE